MELSDGVYEQIKDFDHRKLTEEQESLVNKLISDDELKYNYKKYGLCGRCKQPKNTNMWCRLCNFQQNFQNWTSGNNDIDKFIQKVQLKAEDYEEVLEWIEYDRFENIEYLAKGGFGTFFKAIWKDGPIESWDEENSQWRREPTPVALKYLHNSQNIVNELLREAELHIVVNNTFVVRCYGITNDPEKNDFVMVMEYAPCGNLRQTLNNNFNSLNWEVKIYNLFTIAAGLDSIHRKGLIHHNFHCGKILVNIDLDGKLYSLINDLRLSEPANAQGDKKIYGVLPYVAPEVLSGKEYTQASDVYGFGIIAYEVCTGLPPYYNVAHDEILAIKICQGLRPNSNYKIPQLILDIIQQCWDADPIKRPKARELKELFNDLNHGCQNENSIINQQIREADEINKQLPSLTESLFDSMHPQAVYTSRFLDFKNLPDPKNADNNDNSFEV